jgi:uncharacterized protein (TIGR03437 family)
LTTPAFNVGGRQYVAALHNSDLPNQVFVGREGLIPGVAFRPAAPGDILVVFAVGCGPTNPPATPGAPSAGEAIAGATRVLFGETEAAHAAAMSAGSIGLCQFNVTTPNVTGDQNGDISFAASVGGVSNGQNLYTNVRSATAAAK